MKKLFLTILAAVTSLTMMAAWDGTAATAFAGGDGSKADPYQISTPAEWAYFAQQVNAGLDDNWSRGKYFKLTADIVFNENVTSTAAATLQKGNAFTISPTIGTYTNESSYKAFQGILDGAGHSISGLYYYDTGNAMTLFKSIDGATIKNLVIKDSYIYAGNTLGFICGAAYDATILNCEVIGSTISSWASTNGGIVGFTAHTTKIQNCHTNCTLSVKNCSAGICGKASNNIAGFENDVTIENCYAEGSMTYTKNSDKAGIAYYLYANSTLKDCWYSTANGLNCIYGNTSYSDNLYTVTNCAAMTDLAATVAALNEKAAAITGACQWKADGTIDYTTIPADEGGDDVNSRATDPQPADADLHVEATNASLTLSWTAAADGKTVAQQIYIGTDKDAVAAMTTPTATLGTETQYSVSDLDITTTYYWRVDRTDAAGKTVAGTVWRFRPAHLAFPGAEGYGRLAHGGRGGKVVYVTNLRDDNSEGSLRWALTNGSGPRTVMFKVSGIIDMQFNACKVDEFVTIAGQSAPGKGILVFHSDLGIGSDNICRFLRARRGLGSDFNAQGLLESTGNALGLASGCNYSIADHISLAWGTDETFSSRTSKNITFQRSMIAEALGMAYHRNYTTTTNHGYAATIGGDIGTFSHNLLIDCQGRNWSMGGGSDASGAYAGRLDIFNNVCYNWGHRATDGGAMEVNFVGNYYRVGPADYQSKLFLLQIEGDLKGTQAAYVSGNIRDERDGTLTADKQGDTYEAQITSSRTTPVTWDLFVSKPFFDSYATVEPARDAYKSVISDFGANQPAVDEHDQRMITETLNRTYTYTGSRSGIKGQIDNEKDITGTGITDGIEVFEETAWADDYDSDLNGLPQWWEAITGITNPNQYTAAGYTALEDYLNWLAQPHAMLKQGEQTTVDLKTLFQGYTSSPSFTIENNSATAISASLSGSVLTVTGLVDNTLGSVTMKVTDSEGSTYSRTFNVAVTQQATAIQAPLTIDRVASCEVFTTNGTKVGNSVTGLASGIYLMKAIDTNGNHRTAKIIVR